MNCSVAKTTRKVNTNRKNWDVDAQANIKQVTEDINEKVKLHDYYDVEWRNEAILHSAVFGAKIMDKVQRQNNKRINGSIKNFLKNSIKIELMKVAIARIYKEKHIPIPIIQENLGYNRETGLYSGNIDYITENLKNTSEENDNIIAWCKEAFNDEINEKTGISHSNEFFNRVFANGKLKHIKFSKNDDFGEYTLEQALDVNEDSTISDSENGDNPVDSNTDDSIAAFEHSGEHKDFTIGIDEDIKTYFNTLNKLKSPEYTTDAKGNKIWQLDKENKYGIVNTMNDRECISVLLHQGCSFVDDITMIDSIKRIARQCAGFEAFMKFAEDLENNADFRYKVYNNFAKLVMSKIETVVEDGNGKPNLANKRSNSTTALAFEFRNSIKSTAISVNNYEIADEFDNLNKKITIDKNNTEEENNKIKDLLNRLDTNRNDEDVLQIIGDLTSMLQNYYPTIDRFAITNYLYNAQNNKGEIDIVANLSNLKNILHRTINASKNTSINYNSLQYDIATEKNKAKRYALYNTDYVDNANNQEAQALAELLAPYSAVRVDLNSRNTEGKLSSDVLNNNFLTGFINTLQSSLNKKFKDEEGNITYAKDCPLEHYKEFKFKSNQYNLSNILVEKIENGKVINRGLFRKENGEYVPTEYATDLLRISKFNGATSFDNGKNTLYSKMSKADYITTAVINFFNTEGNIKGTPMANYFMRTPSDSSTQYVITAPRYAITQSGNNALRTPDNKINKNHPIFVQLKNAFLQELIDMGTAINTIFVTDKDGCVTRIEKDGKHLLQFKEGFENKPTSKLYKKYHYNGEVVKNFGKENEELTGNVFKSNRFVIVKEDGTEVNYGKEFIDKFVDFLYGGAIDENGNESLKFIKDGDKVVDINLSAQSENFRNAIDDMISNFIADYTKEAINRVQSSKQFIKSSLSSLIGEDKDNKEFNRKISEFILNTHLMYINFDDLFEGNSKFYGSAQDFLKRAKEVQGSGVPYGVVNYNNTFSITHKTEKKGALLNDKAIIDKIGDIKQYDSFRAVTIVNTVKTPRECSYKKQDGSGEDGVLVKALSANFAKQNGRKRPNDKDLERARKMMKGFGDATVNDAQSYITFEEWIRRIAARGQLMKHLPLIEKIQKGENLTENEMDAFVQVQKNFYYDQYYDHQTGIIVPRQIKNAEFVLVPQFVKGTQLEQVYNLMKENDIDQLNTEETSKAGKHNVLTLWDNDGNLTDKNIKDFKAKVNGAAEYFNYNYLYTQQETPQHVNAKNKAGIQIMKKIVDNIPVGHKLYSVKERFMNLYSANIQSAFNDMMNELNVETDENGYPILDDNEQIKGLDYNKLYDLFKEEAERLGMDSNLSDYFTLEDDVFSGIKQPLMPNFFGNVSNRVESVAQALFNSRITRQTLPGFHGAQVTQIGFKKENIQKSDALRYHSRIDENGKEVYAPYIEVMLPKANFGLSAYDDAKALEMLQEAEADELIGYRIPTEGKQSVAIMKVVGFTNDAQGSTIIVPDGWVPQTGSDFDIDSIYGIQYHSYIGKDGKLHKSSYIGDKVQLYKNYVFSKLTKEELEAIKDNNTITEEDIKDGITTSDIKSEFMADLNHYAKIHNLKSYEEFSKTDIDLLNSKEARDNEILRCMMTILSDESSIEENLGRSKFDAISNEDENNLGAIQKMMNPIERSRRKKRSPYNFFDQADYQDDAMSGAKLKGFSVTRDNLCSVCNTVRPIVSTNAYTMLYDATKYDIKELENSFGKNNVNLSKDKKYIQVRHKTFGWTLTNKNIVGELLTSYSSQTTAHILDAIKEGAAPNVNDLTFAVYKTFVDIGSDYDTAIGFMTQPAVSRIVRAYNKNKSIFTDFNTNPLQQAIRELASYIGINLKDKNKKNISITQLIKEINNNEELKKAFKEIFGVDLNIEKISGNKITFEDFALPTYLLKDRIDETGMFASSPVEDNIIESKGDYPIRTRENANWSDITLSLATDFNTRGEQLTKEAAKDKYVSSILPRESNNTLAYNNENAYEYQANQIYKQLKAKGKLNNIKLNIAGNGIYSLKGFATQKELNEYITNIIKTLQNLGVTISEIRSGGQTGVDEAGIIAAQNLGIKWSINAPNGFKFRDINGKDILSRKQFLDRFGIHNTEEITGERLQQAFDLGILLKYSQYATFSQRIGDVARVMNPDKFGAKKNIFETNKVFDDIKELIDEGEIPLKVRDENKNVISILEAVYPGIGNGTVDEFMRSNSETKSMYPPLYTFLKYATAPSIIINRTLFETQTDEFVSKVNEIERVLGFDSRITEKLYTDFQKYILGEIYSEIPFIKYPVIFDKETNRFTIDTSVTKEDEISRIYGFGHGTDFSSDVRVKTIKSADEINDLLSTKKTLKAKLELLKNNLPKEILDSIDLDSTNYSVEELVSEAFKGAKISSESLNSELGFKARTNIPSSIVGNKNAITLNQFVENVVNSINQPSYGEELERTDFNEVRSIALDLLSSAESYEDLYSLHTKNVINNLLDAYTYYVNDNNIYTYKNKKFEIKNIYNAKADELEIWKNMSPAQKVLWIQQNAKNPGIFGLFKVDLRNSNRNGAQTLEFVEDSVGIEEAYSMFNNAFYSENPLIRYAAADLIKYSFIVEGYAMSQHAVNKVIRNTALRQSLEEGGTGIVNYMRESVKNIESDINIDYIIENYVKSHDIPGLPKLNLNDISTVAMVDENNKETYYELKDGQRIEKERPTPTGVLIVQLNDDNISKLNEHNILRMDEDNYDYCSYFKTTGKKSKVYKFVIKDDVGYIYPLNKLQANEHSEWSTNLDNNKEHSANYFEKIICGTIDTTRRAEFMSPISYKISKNKNIDVNELKDNTVNKINSVASEILKGNVYYLWSNELATKLPKYGDMTVSTINGIEYDIIHVNVLKTQAKYLGENSDVHIQSKDVAYNDLLNNKEYGLKAMGFKKPSTDVFMVKMHKKAEAIVTDEELNSDTLEDLGALSVEAVFANAKTGDKIAKTASDMLLGRNYNKKEDIPVNTADSLFVISNYLTRVVDKINDQLNHFETEDGTSYSVTDPKVIDYIRNNPEARRRYLKLLLDARKIKKQFEAYSAFDTTSTDPELKKYLDNIKDKVVKLDEALTSNGLELFAKDYLKKISTNPLVQGDIITLLDGFYGSGVIEAMINDTQEMPNPLVQIITKEVMADIRAKEMEADERIAELEKTIETIKKEAKAAGLDVSWDNIVDEFGILIQPFKQSFIDDYRTLRQAVDTIKNERTSDGKIDYEALNKAQLELDKWLNDNVELALKGDEINDLGLPIKSFYTRKIELEQELINKAPKLFARYKELKDLRRNVKKRLDSSVGNADIEKELKDIDLELKNLTSSSTFDITTNTFVLKKEKEKENAELLNHYKKKIKELYDEYFDKEENSGFKEELEENLRIVKEAERRDKNGIIQASKYELKFNDRYQRAIEWLRKNAIFNPDPNTYQKVNDAFKVLGSDKNVSVTRKLATLLAKASDAYDIKGRIDGTKLNQEQQRNLTAAQQKEYNDRANADAIAISLIHNAGDNEEVYTKEFYKLLSKEGYSKSIEYKNIVKNINAILSKHYSGKNINFVNMTNDELNKLANLYRELREIRKDIEFTWKGKYSKLHSELIEYKINQDNFDIAKNAAKSANVDMNLWYAVNTELIKDESGKQIRIPNKLIYGKPVPTEEARNKKNLKTGKSIYVDEDKTNAFKVIKGYMISEPSEYYHEEYARRKKQSGNKDNQGNEIPDADGRTFDKWYKDNHVYDPYRRTMIPSKIWMVSRLNNNNEGTWEAGFEQTHSVPKEEYKNPNHKDGISLGINYKDNNGKYKNDIKQNEYEKKLQNEISKLLISLAKVESAKRFFESGYMPIMSKEAEHDYRFYLKETAKGIGWIEDTNRGKDLDDDINYANDYIPDMPMTSMIKDKKNRRIMPEKPVFNEGDNVDEYNKKLEEYEKTKKEIKDEEDKYHKEQLNRDWESVLKRFIKEAAHYNAVQDNRLMLYYGQEILKNQLVYDTNLGRSDLKVNKRKSTASKTVYQTRSSKREYDQYTNWMRRLLFNQWKYDNPRWTRLANLAQSFTSANFMMMNVRGGIANVTLGETQIMAEAFAKEYFGTKDYLKGKTIWMSNITDYISNMYSDKSSSVAGALIKFMNVVDFDNVSGVVEADLDPAVWLTRVRNFMFSPQTMGEHFMQNGAMFSIMLSHRLYKNTNPELNGKTEYIVKGRAEVIRDAHEDALMKILENDTKLKNEFLEFRKFQLSDDNTKKEYAWYRRDMTNEFLKKLDDSKKKEFIKLRKQFEQEALKEFETMPDIMSQFKLGDNGKLAFADGSILSNLNNNKKDNSEVNDAYKILGSLKGRVISVNKKIHGVYDRMGSAQIEKYWWGALAMQYHKHIYPGFMKRYRRHGYYNEERGTIEKGCYNALIDFLSIPIRKYRQDMNDEELRGMEGIQNLFKNISDFCLNIKTNWQLLPDYERKNIRRNLGDVIGVLGAVAIAIGLRALGDDDDEDGIIYNLALYEADRLASESFQFNPFGAASEAKKLWSNPVAVQSIANDILSSMGTMAQILIEGEDYDPYYHSGKYAGEHKLKVYIERRIPVWRGINAILNIGDDNHYYKLGDNMISIIPVKDIATWIKE